MDLKFQVQAKIRRPVQEVFNAVYDPKKLSGYFTTGGATGPLDEGKKVIWRFADYPQDVEVAVKKVEPNQRIVLEWQAMDRPYNTTVDMTFDSIDSGSTLVKIAESGWKENQKDLDSSYGNAQGWMHMICCMKAYIEHGINLREGMF
jgi:uncharacterized protein YndB with AHSA1/START domain